MRQTAWLLVFLAGALSTLGALDSGVRTVYRLVPGEGRETILWLGDRSLGAVQGNPGAPAVTPDGNHAALAVRRGGDAPAFEVLVDGKAVGRWTQYENVFRPALRDDGASWAVDAFVGGNGNSRAYRIVDGQAYGPYRQAEPQSWSPRGGHWFFRTELEKGRGVVVDGKAVGPFDNLQPPAWDPSGTRLALAYSRGPSWFAWVEGKETGPYRNVQLITRPDGAWLGFSVTDKDNRITVVVGGKSFGPYDWIDPALDWISADGQAWMSRGYKKGVAYLLETGKETKKDSLDFRRLEGGGYAYTWGSFGNWSRNVNGLVLGPYDTPSVPLAFADGSLWAFSYLGPQDGRFETSLVQVKGDKPVPGWNLNLVRDARGEAFTWSSGGQETPLLFSRRGAGGATATTTVYTLSKGADGWTVTAGGRDFGPYEDLGRPVVSPDGAHWGVVVRLPGGRYTALVDGVAGLATRPVERADGLVLSDNGASWSFWAWPNKGSSEPQLRITNDRETGPFRWAGNPRFSADGRHWYAWVQTVDGKNQLWFDGKSFGPYAKGEDRHLYDLDNGRFVFGMADKDGLKAVTDQGTYGPYQNLDPVARGTSIPMGDTGPLFGFVGQRKDGRSELWVAPGVAGGGKVYGPYRRLDVRGHGYRSVDGKHWIVPVEKEGSPGQWYLEDGVEVSTDGFDVRPLGDGYLMMVRRGNQESLVRDGTIVGTWSHVFQWTVARDGKTWAAEVQEGDGPGARNLVVVDGRAEPGSELTYRPTAGADRFTWFTLSENGEGAVHTLAVTVP